MKENIVLINELIDVFTKEKEDSMLQLSQKYDKIIEKLNKKRELEYKKIGSIIPDADFTIIKDEINILDPLNINID